jgi:DNA-binding beta-propeller fold protein YncE
MSLVSSLILVIYRSRRACLRLGLFCLVCTVAQPAVAFPNAYVSQTTSSPQTPPNEFWAIDASIDQFITSVAVAHLISMTAFSPDGRWVYAATSSGIYVISTASNAVVEEIPIGIIPGASGIVMSPDGSVAYVTDYGDNTTSVVNVPIGAVVTTVPGMGNIVAISPDGKTLYAPTGSGIALFDTTTYQQSGTIAVAGDTFALSPDGTRAYVGTAGQTEIQEVDTGTKAVVATVQLGAVNPLAAVAFSPDGSSAWVTTAGSTFNNLLVIDNTSNAVAHTIALTGHLNPAISFLPDGSRAYVLDFASSQMPVISTATNFQIDSVQLQGTPQNAGPFVGGSAAPTANFLLTASTNPGGAIVSTPLGLHCSTNNAACTEDFAPGTVVTLVPVMLAGYAFAGWGGDCSGTGSCVLTMNTAHSVSAMFAPSTGNQTYNLTVTATAGGIVQGTNICSSGSSCPNNGIYQATTPVSYKAGQTANLTAYPMNGYAFAGWSGDCSGVWRCFVTMNSAHTVTANFVLGTSATAPSVVPQTGYWYNPAESGRGFTIEYNGTKLFMAAFLYDPSGRSTWYGAGPTAMTGSNFSAPLTAYSGGQTLTGTYQAPTPGTSPGNISITFTDARNGMLTWPGGMIPITRFQFVPNGLSSPPTATQPQTGWWFNPNESGRGYAIEVQDNSAFIAAYMYDDFGNPVWYDSGPAALTNNNTYQGNWTSITGGQTLTGTYQAPTGVTNAGNLTIQFASPTAGTLTLPNGNQIPIQRFGF